MKFVTLVNVLITIYSLCTDVSADSIFETHHNKALFINVRIRFILFSLHEAKRYLITQH